MGECGNPQLRKISPRIDFQPAPRACPQGQAGRLPSPWGRRGTPRWDSFLAWQEGTKKIPLLSMGHESISFRLALRRDLSPYRVAATCACGSFKSPNFPCTEQRWGQEGSGLPALVGVNPAHSAPIQYQEQLQSLRAAWVCAGFAVGAPEMAAAGGMLGQAWNLPPLGL